MQRFTVIDDAQAIVQLPKGIQKQVPMYARGERVYIAHAGGFVRISAKFGETWGTSHPGIKVIDFEADGVDANQQELRFVAQLKVAA